MGFSRRLAGACLLGAMAVSAEKVCDFDCTTAPSINIPTGDNEFCANAWNPEPTGFQCLDLAADGASFQADWSWTGGAPFTVHSYPHVNLVSSRLPVKLDKITKADFAVQWGLGPNATFPEPGAAGAALVTDAAAVAATKAMGTIAYDLWIDEDSEVSSDAAKAKYEIMIWIGQYGAPQPISATYPSVPQGTLTVDKQAFTLYVGTNAVGQTVCSWVLDVPSTNFKLDVVPLIADLIKRKLIPADTYLGAVHFGMEAFYAAETMAFVAKDYTLAIKDTAGSDANVTTTVGGASGTSGQTAISWTPVPTGGQNSAAALGMSRASSVQFGMVLAASVLAACVW